MSHSHDNLNPPRGALWAAAGLLAVALGLAGAARWSGFGRMSLPSSAAVESRALWFEDRADGSIAVLQSPDRREISSVAPGTNGFMRGVLRGLARERHRSGIDAVQPFVLTRWADGRLSLADPATGRTVPLEVFGATNSSTFNQLLEASPGTATVAAIPANRVHPEQSP